MKAKLITKRITLDYTGISEPLDHADVHRDITEIRSAYFEEPDEVLLWEHQADWLTKQLGSACAALSGRFDNRVGDTGQPDGNGRRVTTIWGVPVRYANL